MNKPWLLEPASLVEEDRPSFATAAAVPRRRLVLPVGLVEPAVFAVDFFLVVGASVLSGTAYSQVFLANAGELQSFFGVGLLAYVYCAPFLAARGDYRLKNLVHVRRQMREVTLAWLTVFFLLMSIAFTLKVAESFSRGATLTFFATGWLSLVCWRGFLAAYLKDTLAKGGFAERKIILIGEQAQLTSSAVLQELRHCGYKPVSTFAITEREIGASGMAPSLRSRLNAVVDVARRETVDEIFLLISWDRVRCIENVLNFLNVLPVPVHLVPDRSVSRFLNYPMVHVGATWTAKLRRAPLARWECALKRAVDIVLAGGALIVFSPLMLITALCITLDSPGPILFRQTRNGFSGKSFNILKFRTMGVMEDGPVIRQATRDDPRVTRLGRILRRTNLDELPQLVNVLRGDMSLVGPRPHAAAHNGEYEQRIATYAFRYHVKPGITGWAQVNGYRGETKTVDLMEKRIEHDLWYINNWSIWLDIKILLRTALVGLQKSAY
jgi:undecaprenyl-phosphate galactose phosphotransferase/putative colanic acid biosynthesis UDP-glucose lipid carrier transferase